MKTIYGIFFFLLTNIQILLTSSSGIFLNNLMLADYLEENLLQKKHFLHLPCIRTSRSCLANHIHRLGWQKKRYLNNFFNKRLNITNEKKFISDVLKLMIADNSDVLKNFNEEEFHVNKKLIKQQESHLKKRRKRKKFIRKKVDNMIQTRSEILKLPDFLNTFDLNDFLSRSYITKVPSTSRKDLEKLKIESDDVALTPGEILESENISSILNLTNSTNNTDFIDLANSTETYDKLYDNITSDDILENLDDTETVETKEILDIVNNSSGGSNLTTFTTLLNAMDDIALRPSDDVVYYKTLLNVPKINATTQLKSDRITETDLLGFRDNNTNNLIGNSYGNITNISSQKEPNATVPLASTRIISNVSKDNVKQPIYPRPANVTSVDLTDNSELKNSATILDASYHLENILENVTLLKNARTGLKRNKLIAKNRKHGNSKKLKKYPKNYKERISTFHKQRNVTQTNISSKNDLMDILEKPSTFYISSIANISTHNRHNRTKNTSLPFRQRFYNDDGYERNDMNWDDYATDYTYPETYAMQDGMVENGANDNLQALQGSMVENGLYDNSQAQQSPSVIEQPYSETPYAIPQDLNANSEGVLQNPPPLITNQNLVPNLLNFKNTTWAQDIPAGDIKAVRVCKPGAVKPAYPGKANCLIIGDSISLSYSYSVAAALKNYCQVQLAPSSKAGVALDSTYGLKCLNLFLSTPNQLPTHYDVIVFNFGLHDIDYLRRYPEEYNNLTRYKKNLEKLKKKLLRTGASLAFPLSTPVTFDKEKDDILKKYNKVAYRVMTSQPSITVVDLHHFVTSECGKPPFENCYMMKKPHDVHYGVTGSIMLGKKIAYTIKKLLEKRQRKTKDYSLASKHWIDFSRNATICDIAGTKCPAGYKCMTNIVSRSGHGCCSLHNGVDCGDSWHCCPAGTVCHPGCSDRSCSCVK